MKLTRDIQQLFPAHAGIVTIGNFDGVHIGHQALLNEVVTKAQRVRGESVVLTFDPHPLAVVAPDVDLKFLTTLDEKLVLLEQAGIEHVICLEFSPQLAEISPETFVKTILRERVGVQELLIGGTFRFWKGRAGTIQDLIRWGPDTGFRVTPITPIQQDGNIVSSSTIRQRIQEGRVSGATELLGYQYSLSGIVQRGEQNGSRMGYPTANIPLPTGRVIPPNGVYATIVTVGKIRHHSVSYIGTRPTFHGTERLLEVHIFDMQADFYGQSMTVGFCEQVRGDLVFSNAADLSRQIKDDVRHARQALAMPV